MSDRVSFPTYQIILEQMLSYLPPQWKAGFTGKVIYRLLVAVALSIEAAYALLAKLLRLAIPATSEGIWLRDWVRGVNMVTFGGIPSTVSVRFLRYLNPENPNPAVDIPAGVEVISRRGIRFRTTAAGVIPPDQESVEIACACLTPGSVGNVNPGEIVALAKDLGVIDEVTNLTAGEGGADPESDEAIKRRLPVHIEMLHRATIPATEGAIAVDKERFPEVVWVISERQIGTPGYVKFRISDGSGADSYRPTGWIQEDGSDRVWSVPVAWDTISGVVVDDWPCRRLGVINRSDDGTERWDPSSSVLAVDQGSWRWFHSVSLGRLFISTDGSINPNLLHITLYAGLFERVRDYLENNWIANGIGVDVVAPIRIPISVELLFTLEPSYRGSSIQTALNQAIKAYFSGLRVGATFNLGDFLAYLDQVPGASNIEVLQPTTNQEIPSNAIARLGQALIRLR